MPSKAVNRSTINPPFPTLVVLADSDRTLHEVYRPHFVMDRIELVPAYSGIDCISCLRECAPDLLVIDPVLPWGGGDGVLAILGATLKWAAIPVMVLTASRDIHVLNELTHFPIRDFQVKPLTPEKLAARIRLLLDRTQPYDAAVERNVRLERVIAQRTGNRIGKLRVEATADKVVIRGVARSQEIGASALAAVTESLRRTEAPPSQVMLDIEIAQESPTAPPRFSGDLT